MTHALPDTSPATPPTAAGTSEPVLIAHAVTVVLGALVALGWIALPDREIDLLATMVAVLISTVGAFVARGKVTPTGSPTPSWADVQAVIEQAVVEVVDAQLGHLAPPVAPASPPAVGSPWAPARGGTTSTPYPPGSTQIWSSTGGPR